MNCPVLLARHPGNLPLLRRLRDEHGHDAVPHGAGDEVALAWSGPLDGPDLLEAFGVLCRRLQAVVEACAEVDDVEPMDVLVDRVAPDDLNAVGESGWETLVAMLILGFPEVRWIFADCGASAHVTRWEEVARGHGLAALARAHAGDALFDPCGLRDFVRERTNEALAGLDDLRLPRRTLRAAVVDEERPYAWLHACTAYRFGLRSDTVVTWNGMQERFSDPGRGPHGYWLLLEDMSLNFPDREGGDRVHMLRLEDRARLCGRLDSSRPSVESSVHRILVTGGYSHLRETNENRSYLQRHKGHEDAVVLKPVRGMFDLWCKAGLLREPAGDSPGAGLNHVPGFDWPPVRPAADANGRRGHGAPGKLLRIAETLVHRAERLAHGAVGLHSLLRGAILATEALELTGCRTPTTAITALTLKHRFELLAECSFSGMQYHLNVGDRLKEIERDVGAISKWFETGHQERASLNAQMIIVHELVGVLREAGRFEEEQTCSHRARLLQRRLWFSGHPARGALRGLFAYMDCLLESFPRFLLALLGWVVLLTIGYEYAAYDACHAADAAAKACAVRPAIYAVADAVSAFFSIGPPLPNTAEADALTRSDWFLAVSSVAILSGFLHLGIFIAHVYSLALRK